MIIYTNTYHITNNCIIYLLAILQAAGEHKDHHKPEPHTEPHHHSTVHLHAFVHETLKYLGSVKPPTNQVIVSELSAYLETLPSDHPANLYRKGHGNMSGLFHSGELNKLFISNKDTIQLVDSESDYQEALGGNVLEKSDIGMVKTINNNYKQHVESNK